uniref:Uncharacterized protein n=1 Tax=Arundo donax TaxID=35708 RepID=A0A0A9HIS8_ARUDO
MASGTPPHFFKIFQVTSLKLGGQRSSVPNILL